MGPGYGGYGPQMMPGPYGAPMGAAPYGQPMGGGWGPAMPPGANPYYGPGYGPMGPAYGPTGPAYANPYAPAPLPQQAVPAPGLVPDTQMLPPMPTQNNGTPPNVAGFRGGWNHAMTSAGVNNGRVSGIPSPPARVRDIEHPEIAKHPRISGVQIHVPSRARVNLNGKELSGGGKVRRFSPEDPLMPGTPYKYEVQASIVYEGRTFTRTETIWLRAGRMTELAFDLPEGDGDDSSDKVAKTK